MCFYNRAWKVFKCSSRRRRLLNRLTILLCSTGSTVPLEGTDADTNLWNISASSAGRKSFFSSWPDCSPLAVNFWVEVVVVCIVCSGFRNPSSSTGCLNSPEQQSAFSPHREREKNISEFVTTIMEFVHTHTHTHYLYIRVLVCVSPPPFARRGGGQTNKSFEQNPICLPQSFSSCSSSWTISCCKIRSDLEKYTEKNFLSLLFSSIEGSFSYLVTSNRPTNQPLSNSMLMVVNLPTMRVWLPALDRQGHVKRIGWRRYRAFWPHFSHFCRVIDCARERAIWSGKKTPCSLQGVNFGPCSGFFYMFMSRHLLGHGHFRTCICDCMEIRTSDI